MFMSDGFMPALVCKSSGSS